MSYDLLNMGDLSAAVVAYGFVSSMGVGGKPGMQAAQSFVVSLIARIAAKSGTVDFMGKMDDSQKNQIVVALLSAIAGSYRGGGPLKAAITGVSIDLLSDDILRLLNQDPNSGFFQMGTPAAAAAPAPVTVPPSTRSYPVSNGPFLAGRVV